MLPLAVPPLPAATRAEAALLLCWARVVMDAASGTRAQALMQADLDWACLLQMALQHGIMPLMYHHVQALHPPPVPPGVLAQLRTAFHTHAGRALFLTGELQTILAVLQAHHIVAVPFKGPVLAAAVYGNPLLRQYGDLDILVHKHEVLRARDLLLAQGYRPYPPMTTAQEAAHLRARYHLNVLREDGQVMVELHWAFARRYWRVALGMAQLQERCTTVSLAGTLVRTLAPEDLLLVLAVHGAKHYWPRLGWMCDVAELLRGHPALEWDQVQARARALGVQRLLWLSLCLAQHLLGAPLPGPVEWQIQTDPRVRSLTTQVSQRLFAPAAHPLHEGARQRFYLQLRERPRERGVYLCYQLGRYFHRALAPTAVEHTLLPSSLVGLRPAVRLLRVAGQYGWRALHHLGHLLWQGRRQP